MPSFRMHMRVLLAVIPVCVCAQALLVLDYLIRLKPPSPAVQLKLIVDVKENWRDVYRLAKLRVQSSSETIQQIQRVAERLCDFIWRFEQGEVEAGASAAAEEETRRKRQKKKRGKKRRKRAPAASESESSSSISSSFSSSDSDEGRPRHNVNEHAAVQVQGEHHATPGQRPMATQILGKRAAFRW